MTSTPKAAPKEQFVKMPRELLQSDAWRTLNIHERRFLDYLMLAQMRFAGRQNGNLTAQHRQLIEFGITASAIAPAGRSLERRGLVRCQRHHDAYSPNTYSLTWLSCRGAPPTDDWRAYREPGIVPRNVVARRSRRATAKSGGTSATESGGTRVQNAEISVVENQPVGGLVPRNVVAIYRSSNQGGLDASVESEGGARAEMVAALRVVRSGEP